MFGRKGRDRGLQQPEARSIASIVRQGASHDVWIHEALRKLQAVAGADRGGVWLDANSEERLGSGGPAVFRGEVLDTWEGHRSGDWTLLSLGTHLPQELLSAGKTAEFQQTDDSNHPIVGSAMGMRRGLWVPVVAGGDLRGVVLAASRGAEMPLPQASAEEAAEELGLALEWEERNRLAEQRKTDLELSAHFHAQIAAQAAPQTLLQEGPEGLGSVFALIGERRRGLTVQAPSLAGAEERLEIHAHSGDPAWAHSVERGPLEMIWRRAVETGQMTGAEPMALPLARDIARIVAFPLDYDGTVHGVLLCGVPHRRGPHGNHRAAGAAGTPGGGNPATAGAARRPGAAGTLAPGAAGHKRPPCPYA